MAIAHAQDLMVFAQTFLLGKNGKRAETQILSCASRPQDDGVPFRSTIATLTDGRHPQYACVMKICYTCYMEKQHDSDQLKANRTGKLVLMRHGQTEWAKRGQYTGRTNIGLTEVGTKQAVDAAPLLKPFNFLSNSGNIFVSPLKRAQDTAKLALAQVRISNEIESESGDCEIDEITFQTEPLIAEWSYGKVEGYYVPQIGELLGHPYVIWFDGTDIDTSSLPPVSELVLDDDGQSIPVATTPGESIEEVAARADEFLKRIVPKIEAGEDVLVIAHAHINRVLASRWLGQDPSFGANLILDTASVSVLGLHETNRCIFQWNKIHRG
jgi:probable phosphoglycerate mutase